MRFGVNFGIQLTENVMHAKKAGLDYIEGNFQQLSRFDEEVFLAYKKALEENDIKCEAANCFIPGDFKLTGDEELDEDALKAFLEKGMERGAQVGLKTVVFGSSGAKRMPESYSYIKGFMQLTHFLRDIAAPIAAKYGVTIVVEPLCCKEVNIINNVREGALLAMSTGCDNVADLADLYHMVEVGDTYENVRQLKGILKHAHISNPIGENGEKRVYPKSVEEYDYKGFLEALAYASCETCSIEAGCKDFATEVYAAADTLKKAWASVELNSAI